MTYISFCSGIEAATVAWEPLGWRPVAFSEIDTFPSKLLAAKYPNVPNVGDLTAVDWSQWRGKADICVGGTPCQDFSIAGLRASLAGDRGNITLEFLRAVNAIQPRFVVWENVPGVLNTGDNAFGKFLGGLVSCDEALVHSGGGWPNAGVVDGPERAAAWRVLDAQYFGLAQRRRRVFVVASSPGERHPAEILFEWESLRRDSPPSRETGQGTTHAIAPSITSSGRGFERGGESRGQGAPVVRQAVALPGVEAAQAQGRAHCSHQAAQGQRAEHGMTPSTYETLCECGAVIRTTETTGTCKNCQRLYEIQWPADFKPRPIHQSQPEAEGWGSKPYHVWPDGSMSYRVGKAKAGRLLDGREHSEFPEVRR